MNREYGELLVNISGERIEERSEFMEYINNYYDSPDEYGIDIDEPYFQALYQAVNSEEEAWKLYNEMWDEIDEDLEIDEVLTKAEVASELERLTAGEEPIGIIKNMMDFFNIDEMREFLEHMNSERN